MFCQETLLFETGGRSHYRIPSIIALKDGTILAFCNDRRDTVTDHAAESMLVYAVKKPGQLWGPVQILDYKPGWACYIGSAVYDCETDTAFCFGGRALARDEFGSFTDEQIRAMEAEADALAANQGIHRGDILFKSTDHGMTWVEEPVNMVQRFFTTEDGRMISHGGSCHGSAHGIQLKYGTHKGRLLCPSRFSTGRYSNWEDAIQCCYNNSIYSDDHGKTWYASDAVQQGTGEGTLIERADGTILYNSRSMHRDQKRLLAVSKDGGDTYQDFSVAEFIYEEKNIGCNASFLRVGREELPELPAGMEDITLFVNPRAEDRSNMTICISFDSGNTWTATKSVWAGGCAYSSLEYDAVSRHFFLLYEKGECSADPYEKGVVVLEFDLKWLLSENARSVCGSHCEACSFRERFACKGCHVMKGKPFWGECNLYVCAEQRCVAHCGLCGEVPCRMLQDAIDNGHKSDRLENLMRWKKDDEK